MHFPLGDYTQLPDFHPVLPPAYYIDALKTVFQEKEKEAKEKKILVFCEKEDEETVQQTLHQISRAFPHTALEFELIDAEIPDWEQLLLMSLCRDNIIANSSFSWWGAYLNSNPDKIVCYPATWFGPALKNHDTRDLCPPEWKKINA